jgi:hypothetical protein
MNGGTTPQQWFMHEEAKRIFPIGEQPKVLAIDCQREKVVVLYDYNFLKTEEK